MWQGDMQRSCTIELEKKNLHGAQFSPFSIKKYAKRMLNNVKYMHRYEIGKKS